MPINSSPEHFFLDLGQAELREEKYGQLWLYYTHTTGLEFKLKAKS